MRETRRGQKKVRLAEEPALPAAPDVLLRRREVEKMTGLSRAEIYRRIHENRFPRPVSLGTHAVAWRQSAIQAWIAALPTHGPDRV